MSFNFKTSYHSEPILTLLNTQPHNCTHYHEHDKNTNNNQDINTFYNNSQMLLNMHQSMQQAHQQYNNTYNLYQQNAYHLSSNYNIRPAYDQSLNVYNNLCVRFAVNGISKFTHGNIAPVNNRSIQAGDFGDDAGMIAENSRCIVIGNTIY